MCSEWGSLRPLATITFFGEQQDITDPEAAVLDTGQTTERDGSVHQQAVDDLSGHAHQVTRRAVSFAGRRQPYTFGL
jgi:hypothetical protein